MFIRVFWPVIGNTWSAPFYNTTAKVHLPITSQIASSSPSYQSIMTTDSNVIVQYYQSVCMPGVTFAISMCTQVIY